MRINLRRGLPSFALGRAATCCRVTVLQHCDVEKIRLKKRIDVCHKLFFDNCTSVCVSAYIVLQLQQPAGQPDAALPDSPTRRTLSAVPTPGLAPTKSVDTFLLDVVPPSPCRGHVQLKGATGDYDRQQSVHQRHYYAGVSPTAFEAASAATAASTADSSASAQSSPPPPPPPPSRRERAEFSSADRYERRTAALSSPPASASTLPATFQPPPPVHRRTFQAVSSSPVTSPTSEAPYCHQRQRRRHPQFDYHNETTTAAVNAAYVRSECSLSPSEDDDELDDDEDDPAFAFLQSPAPSIPAHRTQWSESDVGRSQTNPPSFYVERPAVAPPQTFPSDASVTGERSLPLASRSASIAPPPPLPPPPPADDRYENVTSAAAKTNEDSAAQRVMQYQMSLSTSALNVSPPAPHLSAAKQV